MSILDCAQIARKQWRLLYKKLKKADAQPAKTNNNSSADIRRMLFLMHKELYFYKIFRFG